MITDPSERATPETPDERYWREECYKARELICKLDASSDRLATERDTLRSSCEQLTRERDEARGYQDRYFQHWTNALTERDEAREEARRLQGALDAALQNKIGDVRLINVMQTRYGRTARQWEANHEQRKQERDEAVGRVEFLREQLAVSRKQVDDMLTLHDELAAELQRAVTISDDDREAIQWARRHIKWIKSEVDGDDVHARAMAVLDRILSSTHQAGTK